MSDHEQRHANPRPPTTRTQGLAAGFAEYKRPWLNVLQYHPRMSGAEGMRFLRDVQDLSQFVAKMKRELPQHVLAEVRLIGVGL